MRFILYFLLLFALPAQAKQVPPKPPGGGAPLAVDANFLALRDAFRAGDTRKLEQFARRLKRSPLDVYVAYYRLRLGLEQADPGKVKDFLARPEDTPLIDQLRGEWLKTLGKKQQWDLFDAEYPRLLKEDSELTCYALQSRLRSGDPTALNEARGLWFSGKALPESCGVLFDAALEAGIIGEQDVWQRLRLTLEAGNVSLARQLAVRLGGERAVSSAALGSAAADADRYLERISLENAGEGQRMVALFALQRLAKQSSDLAIGRWNSISAHFPESEQRYFYGRLGYEAARNQDVRAMQWFRAAGNAPLDAQQSVWRARAALRMQDWPELLVSIAAMAEAQQREPAWRYWKARALLAAGKSAEAMELLAPLSGEHNFYGQLANEELADQTLLSKAAPYRPGKQEIASMQALPGVQRTVALYRMDMRTEALEEWRWTLRNFNDQELLAAAEIARRNQMYDRAIGAADMTVNTHDFNLRYLAPYREALQPHIREHGLEEAWVYGLMRQESRFATAAKSDAGATGLMQIMPSTARWVARKMGLRDFRHTLLSQIDTNLKLGTYYMKTVLSWFEGNPVLASAAYNAGPNRARKWRGETPLEGAIYAETIPFDETRDYVKKVMSNTVYYARQFDAPPQPLKQRLGVIAPKLPDNQQPVPDEQ